MFAATRRVPTWTPFIRTSRSNQHKFFMSYDQLFFSRMLGESWRCVAFRKLKISRLFH
jgi:hypothetical protein